MGPVCHMLSPRTSSAVADDLVGRSAGLSGPATCITGPTEVSSASSDRLLAASETRLAKYGANMPPDFSIAAIVHWLSTAVVM